MTDDSPLLQEIAQYYHERLRIYGPTPSGVDWNSVESQEVRFQQLARAWNDDPEPFSVLDYGCGYGALAHWLSAGSRPFRYVGYDIVGDMIKEANDASPGAHCTFTTRREQLAKADYVVASGIFNVRLAAAPDAWDALMQETVSWITAHATRAFAFNALSTYSDPSKRRGDLHYADPLIWFDRCKGAQTARVALLHDYPLYEFTLIGRMNGTAT